MGNLPLKIVIGILTASLIGSGIVIEKLSEPKPTHCASIHQEPGEILTFCFEGTITCVKHETVSRNMTFTCP